MTKRPETEGGGSELAYGFHTIAGLIRREPACIRMLWVEAGRRDRRALELVQSARAAGVALQWSPRSVLDGRTGAARHQGFVAEVVGVTARDEAWLQHELDTLSVEPLLLVLDGVTDPHNLGACLRSADAAGVHALLVPRDRAAGLNATVRKVASGAAETVPLVAVANLGRTLKALAQRGIWIVGADGDAEHSLYESTLSGPLALVLGAEGTGIRRLTRERCDSVVRIPMLGTVASLNVSVAAGVLLFEAVRQRACSLATGV